MSSPLEDNRMFWEPTESRLVTSQDDTTEPEASSAAKTKRAMPVIISYPPGLESMEDCIHRPQLLDKLERTLAQTQQEGQTGPKTVVITGAKGTGKTQLIAQYVEKHKQEYHAIFWIDGRDPDTMLLSFRRCYDDLERYRLLPFKLMDDRKSNYLTQFYEWLSLKPHSAKWLLVCSNAKTFDHNIVPHIAGTHMILEHEATEQTSHAAIVSPERLPQDMSQIEVPRLSNQEVAAYLRPDFGGQTAVEVAVQLCQDRELLPNTLHLVATGLKRDSEKPQQTWETIDLLQKRYDKEEISSVDLGSISLSTIHAVLHRYGRQPHESTASQRRQQDDSDQELTLDDDDFDLDRDKKDIDPQDSLSKETAMHDPLPPLDDLRQLLLRGAMQSMWGEAARVRLFPLQFLRLLQKFDSSEFHGEFLRLAALGLTVTQKEYCDPAGIEIPQWLLRLLSLDSTGRWNTSLYDQHIQLLLRYGVAHPYRDDPKGMSVTGLSGSFGTEIHPDSNDDLWAVLVVAAAFQATRELSFSKQFLTHSINHRKLLGFLLDRLGDDQPDSKWALLHVGRMWQSLGRFFEADSIFFKIPQIQYDSACCRSLHAAEAMSLIAKGHFASSVVHPPGVRLPAEDDYLRWTCSSLRRIGLKWRARSSSEFEQFRKMGYDEASRFQAQAHRLMESKLGDSSTLTLIYRANLAFACARTQEYDEAITQYKNAIELLEIGTGNERQISAIARSCKINLALAYQGSKRWDLARELQEELLSDHKYEMVGAEDIAVMRALALSYLKMGQFDNMIDMAEHAERCRARLYGTESNHETLLSSGPSLPKLSTTETHYLDAPLYSSVLRKIVNTITITPDFVWLRNAVLPEKSSRRLIENATDSIRLAVKRLLEDMQANAEFESISPVAAATLTSLLNQSSFERRIAKSICERIYFSQIWSECGETRAEAWLSERFTWIDDSILAQPSRLQRVSNPAAQNDDDGIQFESFFQRESRKRIAEFYESIRADLFAMANLDKVKMRGVSNTVDPGYIALPDLDTILHSESLFNIREFLFTSFDQAATDQWAWILELRDCGYNVTDIAEFLLEQHQEYPWIRFEPWLNIWLNTTDVPRQHTHQSNCIHRGGYVLPKPSETVVSRPTSNQDATKAAGTKDRQGRQWSLVDSVASLCGFAGVLPLSADVKVGTVEDKQRTASVVYHGDQHSPSLGPSSPPSTFFQRLETVLRNVCSAARLVQDKGACCDSFTFLRRERTSTVELHSIEFEQAVGLLTGIKDFNLDPNDSDRRTKCRMQAALVLQNLLDDVREQDADQVLEEMLLSKFEGEDLAHMCALAVQFLSLSFLLYCQAHVAPLQPFFLELQIDHVRLLGIRRSEWYIVAKAADLACVSSMIGGKGFVFSFQRLIDEPKFPFPDKLEVLASPEDILDTWGPGALVTSSKTPRNEPNIISILVGGGSINQSRAGSSSFHWSPGWEWSLDDVPTMDARTKVLVGAKMELNSSCSLTSLTDQKRCLTLSRYCRNLGTRDSYWELFEKQVGLQGGQYITAVANFTWNKRTGSTYKDRLALNVVDELLVLLECPCGLQVSFCSGLTRRVRMRELLADVLPSFVAKMCRRPNEWDKLVQLNILHVLRYSSPESFGIWFCELQKVDPQCFDSMCAMIQSVVMVLRDTGVDPSGRLFRVAWISSLPTNPLQCLDIRIEKSSEWARILRDTSDCATFAYLTMNCLQIGGLGCRNPHTRWHGDMRLIETEVYQFITRPEKEFASQSKWSLQHGQVWYIGCPEGELGLRFKARVDRPDSNKEAQLIIAPSSLRISSVRLKLKRPMTGRLQERLILVDASEQAFIFSGEKAPIPL